MDDTRTDDIECDITAQLTGTEVPDKCPDCDFVFGIDATTTDTIGADCPSWLTLIEDDHVKHALLGFESIDYYFGYYGDMYTYHNVLWAELTYNYDGRYSYYHVIAFYGGGRGAAEVNGLTLTWTCNWTQTERTYTVNGTATITD